MRIAPILCLAIAAAYCGPPAPPLSYAKTMRVDYFHRGGQRGEMLSLDRAVAEGPWAGSQHHLVDQTALGAYRFEVVDRRGEVLYSRGFSSIYGEWMTTPEAKGTDRTFHESLRFPWPTDRVTVIVKKRDARNSFETFWSAAIDPASTSEAEDRPYRSSAVLSIVESGASADKVDLLLLGAGYQTTDASTFRSHAERLVKRLFEIEPFKSRKSAFNVRALDVSAGQVRIDRNIFGLPRYMLVSDNRALRKVAAPIPYDVVAVLADDTDYGGGGIFNLQSTVAAANADAGYVFVHEFAHNLAGVGDEYVGNVTYATGGLVRVEPWEPNLTALLDPPRLKWRDLVQPGTPLPTPHGFAGSVGAFEGAGYEAKGLYRPEADCIMYSRQRMEFCRVCRRAIERAIEVLGP